MGFGFDDDEEDNPLVSKEPQVTSNDPAERKAARALRIKRREDAIKRAKQAEQEATAPPPEEEPGPIAQATAFAAEELQRLTLEGTALVSNVKVCIDEREVLRRNEVMDRMLHTSNAIEKQIEESQAEYEAITANWDAMMQLRDPIEIDESIQAARKRCDSILGEKDEVIARVKQDLKDMDTQYYVELEKQDNDIKELSDRIERQITLMQRAYEAQLLAIENAIIVERVAMIDLNNKRWEAMYKQRDKEEVMHLDQKYAQLDEHKQANEDIMWQHIQKYREAKIELETLVQELQKELEKLKAMCLINKEKIGYTYQILKKREEENVFVRSQQKRKLNKMTDLANSLRAKIRQASADGALEEINSHKEIIKIMQMMADIEQKNKAFSKTHDEKFFQMWQLSSSRCGSLVRDLRNAEVAIHAHILAESPPPPPPPPPLPPVTSNIDSPHGSLESLLECLELNDPNNEFAKDAKDNLVRHILQLVSNNTGFLIEDRLLKLLEKYKSSSKNLVTLDAIFMALEIQGERDIELLCKVFLKYAFCPICVGIDIGYDTMDSTLAVSQDAQSVSTRTGDKKDRTSIRQRSSAARSSVGRSGGSASTPRSGHVGFRGGEVCTAEQIMVMEAEEAMQICGDPHVGAVGEKGPSDGAGTGSGRKSGTGSRKSAARPSVRGVTVSTPHKAKAVRHKPLNPYLCPVGHPLEIEPMQVLAALSEFMNVFVSTDKKEYLELLESLMPPVFSTASRAMKEEVITNYWMSWKNIFTTEKEKFWDSLIIALTKYLTLLQDRERTHKEVCVLRKRNAELRRVVRGVLPELPKQPTLPQYLRPVPAKFYAAATDKVTLPPLQKPYRCLC